MIHVRTLWIGVIAFGALAVVAVAMALTAIRSRDRRAIETANEAIREIETFCTVNDRLPDAHQFADHFPGLSTDTGWFYRLGPGLRNATLQYPMAMTRSNAPGTRKISEFTGTTYAYQADLSCRAPSAPDRVRDPYQLTWR